MATDEELRQIHKRIVSAHRGAETETRDEEQQRVLISKVIQGLMTRTDPMTLMSMLVVALAFMADEHGVNRDHLVSLLREAKQRHALVIGGVA
jgi:hypothetical protein